MGLKIQQLRIAVGVTVKGDPKLLYLGGDSAKCDAALAEAGADFEIAAALPRGLTPLVSRYPAREALNAKVRAQEAKAREEAVKNAKRNEAEALAIQAKKLAAESAAITKELSKSEK